jgi:hypothetical protein
MNIRRIPTVKPQTIALVVFAALLAGPALAQNSPSDVKCSYSHLDGRPPVHPFWTTAEECHRQIEALESEVYVPPPIKPTYQTVISQASHDYCKMYGGRCDAYIELSNDCMLAAMNSQSALANYRMWAARNPREVAINLAHRSGIPVQYLEFAADQPPSTTANEFAMLVARQCMDQLAHRIR